jgi:hypothetical protein
MSHFGRNRQSNIINSNRPTLAMAMVCVRLCIKEYAVEIAVCKIEELDGDFGGVGGDLGGCEEEVEETGVARF